MNQNRHVFMLKLDENVGEFLMPPCQKGLYNTPTAPLQLVHLGYDTKLHLMVRIPSCSFGECKVPLHCYCCQVYSDLEW